MDAVMNEQLMARCSCSHCGNHLEFPLEGAGMTINCPHCQQPTELNLAAPAPSESRQLSAPELLAAFGGSVPKTPVSFFYRVGLVLVTITMILLPVLYICLIGVAAWGLYYFASHSTGLLKPMRGGGRLYIFQLLLYCGGLFIGLILLLFMVKPLFARRPRHAQPLALNPGVESTLYAFIARICDTVGAPMPTRIDLDCNLNASAGFRRGALSLFGSDLVLTIGLPLVAGLTVRELAGVIAHEFGHFTQGFGLRLSYVIRSVNGWFARVVYERDAWDLWLAEVSEDSEDWRIMLVATCARGAVGCSRLLLMLLMFVGHGVSCFLLRQMEYDADSYEIKLAGSPAFESTARKMAVLGKVLEVSYKQMQNTWQTSKRLPEDFPAFMNLQFSKLSPGQKTQIEDTLGLSKTGLFDTHPSDGDRIRCARRAGEPGVFHLDSPATVLFSNFDIAARQVTQVHYADDLGIDYDSSQLTPVAMPAGPSLS
jgi:Zn-dependent protease with chaperone function